MLELDGAPQSSNEGPDNLIPMPLATAEVSRGSRPAIARGLEIGFYSPLDLDRVVQWIRSDGLLHTDDQLFEAAMEDLRFRRRGARIEAALRASIERTRRSA